jgi:glyoxylase-like metal-dependent hydrolase (beta-lactamase superfamily II)
MAADDYAIRPWRMAPLPSSVDALPAASGTLPAAIEPLPAASVDALPAAIDALHAAFVPTAPPADLSAAATALFTGYALDLGGRLLEFLHTPGHSADSIMLFDRKSGILFTGDTVYPAALLVYAPDNEAGRPAVDIYAETMAALQELIHLLHHVCGSHNVPVSPPTILADIAGAFSQVQAGEIKAAPDERGLKHYPFDGFSIVTKK